MVDIVAMEDIVESDRLILNQKPKQLLLPTPMLILDTGAMGVAMEVMVDMAGMVDTVARDLQMPMPIMDMVDIEVAMEVTVVMAVDMDMAVKINVPKDVQSPKHFSFQITYTK